MINFIESHYFIFFYNIGLILAMTYIVFKALRCNSYTDSQIMRIMIAAVIWPLLVGINMLATFFGNFRNMLNMLITAPVIIDDTEHEFTDTDVIDLDGVKND